MTAVLHYRLLILLLFMIIFLIGADTFLVSPLIPLLSRELHMSVGQGGLLVTAYALAYAVAALVFGPLSDRVGRRKMILWGTFAFGLFSLLCGVAWNFWTLFLFRALSGFAAAATAPQVWASVGDWIPYEKRGKAVGIIAAALSVSQIIGVPAGAFIADAGNWRTPFWVLSILAFVIWGGAFGIYPRVHRSYPPGTPPDLLRSSGQVMTNGQAFSGLCVTFFLMLASFGMYTYLGSWLATAFHLKVTMVGIIIVAVGVGNFVGNMVGGFLSDRYGKRGMLMWALTVMAVTLFMLPHTVYSLTSALICIFVWMVSGGASLTALNAILTEMAPHLRGTMMSLNNSFMYVGTTVGAALGGLILERGGFAGVGLMCAVSAAIAILLVGIAVKITPVRKAAVRQGIE